jgi:phosphate transport system substrate-binding protein
MNWRTLLYSITVSVILAGLIAACAAPASAPAAGAETPAAEEAAPEAAESGEATTVTVSGAFALFPLMTLWAEEYGKVNPNLQFDIQAGGAGKGMTDMLSGAADIAMLSREPRQEELDQGSYLVPVTIDSVVGTVNASNPNLEALLTQGLTSEEANAIWVSGETTTWGQLLGTDSTDPINVYTRSDSSGAAEMWVKFAGGEAQEELKGTAVNGDPGVAEAVRQDPLGVGYNNVGFSFDPTTGEPIEGLRVIPIDLNGDNQLSEDENFYNTRNEFTAAVAEGKYPFPPARILYLVTKDEPSPAIGEFYRWVLNEGQAFVEDAGYVKLTDEQIQEALALVEE